jgi:tetratricopeptide (TPR) repeat protein
MRKGALSARQSVRNDLRPICAQAKSIWATPELPHYTDHTVSHSARVIKHVEDLAALLKPAEKLNDHEAFVLLAAALLHDVGMQRVNVFDSDLAHHLFTSEEVQEGRSSTVRCEELVRERHHLISAEWIRAELSSSWPSRDYVEEIASVVRGHTKADLSALQDYRKAGEPMRIRLLAALLRLADELDLDFQRVRLDRLKHASITPRSMAHWWKCHYVESVDVLQHGVVQVTFRFSGRDTSEVRDIVCGLVLDGLRQKIANDQLIDVLWGYGLPLKIGEAVILQDAGITAKEPLPQPVLHILRREFDSLTRQQLAGQALPSQREGAAEARATQPSGISVLVPAQTEQSALQQARNLWAHGGTVQAVETLERAAAAYPGSAPVQSMLGDLLLSRGKWRAAETAARKAVDSQFGYFLAHLTLGITLGHRAQHKKALEHLRITDLTCQSMPVAARYHARVHMAIARSLAALGDYWYAVERIDSADALSPPSGAEAADQPDRELHSAAISARRTADGMALETGTWEIAKLRFQDVLGEWAKIPVVRFEKLRTLMEGMTLAGSSTWVDYVFNCEFQLVNLAAGFLLRADAWATSGLMAQIIPGKLRVHQMLHSNYFAGPLIERDLPAPVSLYEWHRVRFEVRANKLRAWIDDQPLEGGWVEFLGLYRTGKVGFRLWGREFTLYRKPRVKVTKMWVPKRAWDGPGPVPNDTGTCDNS